MLEVLEKLLCRGSNSMVVFFVLPTEPMTSCEIHTWNRFVGQSDIHCGSFCARKSPSMERSLDDFKLFDFSLELGCIYFMLWQRLLVWWYVVCWSRRGGRMYPSFALSIYHLIISKLIPSTDYDYGHICYGKSNDPKALMRTWRVRP